MQKGKTEPLSAHFQDASAITELQSLELKIEKLDSPRAKAGFERLKERQQASLEMIKGRFEANRKRTVEAMARDIRDEHVREQHPKLKPKYLPGPSLAELDASAKIDAEFKYQRIVDTHIRQACEAFLVEQRRHVGSAMRAAELKGSFNRRAAVEPQQENTKGKGKGG